MGAFIILGWLFVVSAALILDRVLVRIVKPYTLSILETVAVGLIFILLILSIL